MVIGQKLLVGQKNVYIINILKMQSFKVYFDSTKNSWNNIIYYERKKENLLHFEKLSETKLFHDVRKTFKVTTVKLYYVSNSLFVWNHVFK